MDPVNNPYNPGAGGRPPELVGRDDILEAAQITVKRIAGGKHSRSLMLLGLRGVGKTVLLNEIKDIAVDCGLHAGKMEAPANKKFLEKAVPLIRKVLLEFDETTKTKSFIDGALGAVQNFASVFKVSAGGVEVGVKAKRGIADSGDLATDLTDLLVTTAKAAQSAKTGIIILVDEVQYLGEEDLSALVVALHEVSQQNLPLALFGAGLPQLPTLAAEANSYAERLFDYRTVGSLSKKESIEALKAPAEAEGVKWETAALTKVVNATEGYPFFLQEWGFQAWNASPTKTIAASLIPSVNRAAIARLDKGFFKSRHGRMTDREVEYVRAMADLGAGSHRSGEIAKEMGVSISAAAPIRSSLIEKGMIYSPSGYGDAAFTVPMFDGYLRRVVLKLEGGAKKSRSKSAAKKAAKKKDG